MSISVSLDIPHTLYSKDAVVSGGVLLAVPERTTEQITLVFGIKSTDSDNTFNLKHEVLVLPAGSVGRHVLPFKFSAVNFQSSRLFLKVKVIVAEEPLLKRRVSLSFGKFPAKRSAWSLAQCTCSSSTLSEEESDRKFPEDKVASLWVIPAAWFATRIHPLVALDEYRSSWLLFFLKCLPV